MVMQRPPSVETLIVLARDQASLYEFLKPRQDGVGHTLVILDRRERERRATAARPEAEQRNTQRRVPTPQAALALMSVLGFMVLHRAGESWTA
jgi:hypothetical protein